MLNQIEPIQARKPLALAEGGSVPSALIGMPEGTLIETKLFDLIR